MGAFEPKVIGVTWVGIDELTPTMNRISGGLTNMGRQSNYVAGGMGRNFSLLDQQMRIVRRSAEYMVAGFGLYKLQQAFTNYKTFRSELGQLNANLNVGRSQLNDFGKAAIDVSNRTATPLNEVVQSFQNIAASIPNVSAAAKRHLIPAMALIEASASRILDVTPQAFGAATLQAARTFYGARGVNPTVLNRVANQVITARYRAGGGITGQQMISYMPTLTSGAKAGRFTFEQALALFTVSQRTLGRPAQTMQYLRQLFIRLRSPTKAEQPFFAQAGIGSTQLANNTGMQLLMQLITHAASLPGGVPAGTLKQAISTGNWKDVNFTGEAAQFLQKSIGGRIQSLTAINAIARGIGQIAVETRALKKPIDYVNGGLQRFLDQNRMSQAANKFSNMTVTMISSLNPLIDLLSRGVGGIAGLGTGAIRGLQRAGAWVNRATGVHALNRATNGIGGTLLDTGATVGAIMLLRRMGIFGKVSGLMGRTPFLGKLLSRGGGGIAESAAGRFLGGAIRGPLDVQALGSALRGVANGTPTAPFWVVIHPLSLQTVPSLFGGKGGGGKSLLKTLEDASKTGAKYAAPAVGGAAVVARRTIASRIAAHLAGRGAVRFGGEWAAKGVGLGIGMRALGPAGVVADALIFPDEMAHPGAAGKGMTNVTMGDYTRRVTTSSLIARYLKAAHGNVPGGVLSLLTRFASGKISEAQATHGITNYFAQNIGQLGKHRLSPGQAGAFYKYVDPIYNLGKRGQFISRATSGGFIAGQADLLINIEPTNELKGLIKPQQVRAKVPTKYWGHGAPPPTSRAKTTARH